METLSYFTENVVYIGTGKHEVAVGRSAVKELLIEEIRELPLPFLYDMYDYAEAQVTENQKNAFANFKVVLVQGEHSTQLDARFTGSCIRMEDGWKISCMHMSVASGLQDDGEFFPLRYGMDLLTGLENRTRFNEKLKQCNQSDVYACIVADINNLKLCNEKYGHGEGDAMIVDTAQAIADSYREIGRCYRIGGDEFCVLIPESGKAEFLHALEMTKAGVEAKNSEREIPLSVAFGYAVRESAEESIKELFDRSAEMMHDVKFRMKNEFSVYREEKITNYLNVLKFLKKITDNYFFIWDIPRDELWFFDDVDKEYAVHINEKPTITSGEVARFVYPPDCQMLSEDLKKIAQGVQKEHNLNYRWINKKGEIVWINCYGQTITDDEGRPFCMIGRVSDQALRHLYHPVTKLFNKEKLLQDFAQGLVSGGYFMLLSVDNLNADSSKNVRGSGIRIIRKCAEVLEKSEIAQYIWHTEENCFALYLDADSETEVRERYDSLLKELEGICTISAGVVPDNGEVFEYRQDLYTCAKLTMNKAQKIGENSLLFFVKEDMEKQKKTVKLMDELLHSIENGCKGFYLNYQPLVRSGNYQIYGAEALLRYHSESMGEVYPDEFVPILEQTKLINKIGLWILETALKQCREWRKWIPDFHMNVNFSVVQLSEPDIAEKVLNILDKTGMPGEALTIELTESIQIHDISYLNEIFRVWREAGVELSIDDFGTGYASMGYLNELNVAEIKIDRTFVAQIGEATYNYKLISSVIDFAKNTNIRIICEGVEDIHELIVLEQLTPNLIQGYLFARPCDKVTFEHSFLDGNAEGYQKYKKQIQEIYQYRNMMNVVHFDAKDILRETEVGLWIIRINEEEQYYELFADETMERVLGVDRKYTPEECYRFWYSRIKPEYTSYVAENIKHIMESENVVQLQYPWQHPKLGEVMVRCSGKRLEDSGGMVILNGYHRILSTIEEMTVTEHK